MKDFILNLIHNGNYKLADLETRIKHLFVTGDLTEAEMAELLSAAANGAKDSAQVDLYDKLVDLEHRIVALEQAGYAVWTPGYTTRKGEIVRYNVTSDNDLDLCQYDGGRSETALSIGKIDGWFLLNHQLEKIATITKDANGAFVVTELTEEQQGDA